MGKRQDPVDEQPEATEDQIEAGAVSVDANGEGAEAEAMSAAAEEGALANLLEDARAKADENWDLLMRARAEMENIKRRHERELENAHKFALDRFVSELLGVWDSLELGHAAAQEENTDVAKLIEGTELTLKLLTDVMGKFGVEQIDPMDQPFNPELHQAMTMQPRDDIAPNTVIAVIQKGYTLNGRLVRPAMVMVSSAAK